MSCDDNRKLQTFTLNNSSASAHLEDYIYNVWCKLGYMYMYAAMHRTLPESLEQRDPRDGSRT